MASTMIGSSLLLLAQLPPGLGRQDATENFVKEFDGKALEPRPPGPDIVQAITAVAADIAAFDQAGNIDGTSGIGQSINAIRILLRFRETIPESTTNAILEALLAIVVNNSVSSLRLCCVRCMINLVFENAQAAKRFWSEDGAGLAAVTFTLRAKDGGDTVDTTLSYHTVRIVYMMVSQSPDLLSTALSPKEDMTVQLARAVAGSLQKAGPGCCDGASAAVGDACKLYVECGKLLYALDLPELAVRHPLIGSEVAASVYATAVAVLADCGAAVGTEGERGAEAMACCDASLQLLMCAPPAAVFSAVTVSVGASPAAETSSVGVSSETLDAARGRCEQALLRVLDQQLLRAAQVKRSVEQAAMLTPILVVLHQLCANSSASRAALKSAVFPTPWQSSGSGSSTVSPLSPPQLAATGGGGGGDGGVDAEGAHATAVVAAPAMDPADAPPDSLRGRLMHHMTSLDSQLKRCVAEFLFLLCGEDATEFTARTGFGNAVALLQIKGLC